jgi:hypothetical protein
LVQAANGDDEITRQVAAAHIAACEGMLAVIARTPTGNQIWEIRFATEVGVPVLLLSDETTVDSVEGRPVQTFTLRPSTSSSTLSPPGNESAAHRALLHRVTPGLGPTDTSATPNTTSD